MTPIWTAALALVVVSVLAAVWRTLRGPSAADRAVAAELVFVASVTATAILSVLLDFSLLLDLALVAVLVGFLTTIGLSHFVDRTEDRT